MNKKRKRSTNFKVTIQNEYYPPNFKARRMDIRSCSDYYPKYFKDQKILKKDGMQTDKSNEDLRYRIMKMKAASNSDPPKHLDVVCNMPLEVNTSTLNSTNKMFPLMQFSPPSQPIQGDSLLPIPPSLAMNNPVPNLTQTQNCGTVFNNNSFLPNGVSNINKASLQRSGLLPHPVLNMNNQANNDSTSLFNLMRPEEDNILPPSSFAVNNLKSNQAITNPTLHEQPKPLYSPTFVQKVNLIRNGLLPTPLLAKKKPTPLFNLTSPEGDNIAPPLLAVNNHESRFDEQTSALFSPAFVNKVISDISFIKESGLLLPSNINPDFKLIEDVLNKQDGPINPDLLNRIVSAVKFVLREHSDKQEAQLSHLNNVSNLCRSESFHKIELKNKTVSKSTSDKVSTENKSYADEMDSKSTSENVSTQNETYEDNRDSKSTFDRVSTQNKTYEDEKDSKSTSDRVSTQNKLYENKKDKTDLPYSYQENNMSPNEENWQEDCHLSVLKNEHLKTEINNYNTGKSHNYSEYGHRSKEYDESLLTDEILSNDHSEVTSNLHSNVLIENDQSSSNFYPFTLPSFEHQNEPNSNNYPNTSSNMESQNLHSNVPAVNGHSNASTYFHSNTSDVFSDASTSNFYSNEPSVSTLAYNYNDHSVTPTSNMCTSIEQTNSYSKHFIGFKSSVKQHYENTFYYQEGQPFAPPPPIGSSNLLNSINKPNKIKGKKALQIKNQNQLQNIEKFVPFAPPAPPPLEISPELRKSAACFFSDDLDEDDESKYSPSMNSNKPFNNNEMIDIRHSKIQSSSASNDSTHSQSYEKHAYGNENTDPYYRRDLSPQHSNMHCLSGDFNRDNKRQYSNEYENSIESPKKSYFIHQHKGKPYHLTFPSHQSTSNTHNPESARASHKSSKFDDHLDRQPPERQISKALPDCHKRSSKSNIKNSRDQSDRRSSRDEADRENSKKKSDRINIDFVKNARNLNMYSNRGSNRYSSGRYGGYISNRFREQSPGDERTAYEPPLSFEDELEKLKKDILQKKEDK